MPDEAPLSATDQSAVAPTAGDSAAKCPFHHTAGGGTTNRDWWPNRLKVELLHQHSAKSDPMGGDFDYAKEFKSLDLAALKQDLAALSLDALDTMIGQRS